MQGKNLWKPVLLLVSTVLSIAISVNANAAQPIDFDDKPISQKCTMAFLSYMSLLEIRDRGYSQQDALKLNASRKPGEELPVEAIRYAYEYSWLDKENLSRYSLWACHAKEIDLPIKPLSYVAKEMQACLEKGADKKCMLGVRNRMLGLPEDYRKIEYGPSLPIAVLVNYDKCKTAYPRDALRNEMTGSSAFRAEVNSEGVLDNVELVRSSGWRILDEATLLGLKGCKVVDAKMTEKMRISGHFDWTLESATPGNPAELMPETCRKSDLIRLAKNSDPGLGIVVGVFLQADGKINKIQLQWGMDAKLDRESIEFVRSCIFKPAFDEKGSMVSSISLRLFPLRSN